MTRKTNKGNLYKSISRIYLVIHKKHITKISNRITVLFNQSNRLTVRLLRKKHTDHSENRTFEKITFDEKNPACGIYEECTFIHCNMNNADLSGVTFRNCLFEGCDLSLARLRETGFQEIRFANCKLLGMQFCDCRKLLLEFEFESCLLKLSVFNKLVIKNTRFTDCNLQEADFTGTDLTGTVFTNCDLMRATFEHTTLEEADLRSAYNFSINPETNRIRKARFSLTGVTGLLDVYGIEIE